MIIDDRCFQGLGLGCFVTQQEPTEKGVNERSHLAFRPKPHVPTLDGVLHWDVDKCSARNRGYAETSSVKNAPRNPVGTSGEG